MIGKWSRGFQEVRLSHTKDSYQSLDMVLYWECLKRTKVSHRFSAVAPYRAFERKTRSCADSCGTTRAALFPTLEPGSHLCDRIMAMRILQESSNAIIMSGDTAVRSTG